MSDSFKDRASFTKVVKDKSSAIRKIVVPDMTLTEPRDVVASLLAGQAALQLALQTNVLALAAAELIPADLAADLEYLAREIGNGLQKAIQTQMSKDAEVASESAKAVH